MLLIVSCTKTNDFTVTLKLIKLKINKQFKEKEDKRISKEMVSSRSQCNRL